VFKIALRDVAPLRRDDVAGAVEAALLTEGDVHIEREPAVGRNGSERGAKVACAHAFVELIGGGIGGVAWTGPVVAGDEFAMHGSSSEADAEAGAKIRPTPRNPAHGIMERKSHFG
jgi:hypothetical protein